MGSASSRVIAAILVVAALAIGFWMLLLGPKREEANRLGAQVESLQAGLSEAQARLAAAETAREEFPQDYRQLVTLGQAVPESDDTSSLIVELGAVAERAGVEFESIQLSGSGEMSAPVSAAPAPAPTPEASAGASGAAAVPAATTVPPTEAAAALMPLGASVGPAGLGVMPYTLSFSGSFFRVANFIAGIDRLVRTGESAVAVDGRLITLDGFALAADPEAGFPALNANFTVTTYLVPPSQGTTAGASSTAPSVAPPTGSAEAAPSTSGATETTVAR